MGFVLACVLAFATASCAASASAPQPEPVDLTAPTSVDSVRKPSVGHANMLSIWVDLDLPALSEVPLADRAALRSSILAQQAQVMLALHALGAQELARVQQVRNAVAVRLDATQIDAARALPGVRLVRLVRNIERRPPAPKN